MVEIWVRFSDGIPPNPLKPTHPLGGIVLSHNSLILKAYLDLIYLV